MTDTLADSRTSSRMFTEGVPLVVEDVTGRPDAERAAMLADPGFGRYFTDRMFVARYRAGAGLVRRPADRLRARCSWTRATATLHYAQSIFEGLKAYAQPDGSVATFRPEANAARFVRGAKRLAMPPVPEEAFLAAVDALVDADRDWVPTGADQTLYIRPYQMATEPFLGVRPAPRVPVPGHRQPGRARTSRAACSRSRSTCPRTTSGPRPAAPATSSAPATTRPACWPRSRPSRPAATRSSGSTRWRSATSRRWAG